MILNIHIRKLFLLLPLLFLSITIGAQNGSVKGRVFNSSSNEPLGFVTLGINGTNLTTLSDTAGGFAFTGLKPGYYKIAAQSVGFEPFLTEEFHVTNARAAFIDIALKEKPLELDEVVVKATAFKRSEESPVSLKSIGIDEIERS